MRALKVGDRVKIVIEGRLDYLDDSGLKINGKVYDTGEYSHIEKLSSEQPTLILEPGKEYRLKNGDKLVCLSVSSLLEEGHPVLGEQHGNYYISTRRYTLDGYFYREGDPTQLDIIGPWNPKPDVDWSLYSKWTKAVAMDKNGIWHWFDARPVLTRADTLNAFKGYLSGIIPPEYAPKNADGTPWVGNWEDSLVVREED